MKNLFLHSSIIIKRNISHCSIVGVIILFFIGIISLSSCQKQWACEIPDLALQCVRNTDTVVVNIDPTTTYYYSLSFVDSVAGFYQKSGYTVTYLVGTPSLVRESNEAIVKAYEDNGVKCSN